MKQVFIFLVMCFVSLTPFALRADSRWKRADAARNALTLHPSVPGKALVFTMQEEGLKTQLGKLPDDPALGQVMELPLADGTTRNFRVWRSPMMPGELAAKYPGINTYTGVAVDNPNITAKLDYTLYGFHAIIFDGINISLVDPAGNNQAGYYTAHYKKDEARSAENMMKCGVSQDAAFHPNASMDVTQKSAFRTSNDFQLRTYRLALACDHFYASAVTGVANPTIEQVLSKMITSMNRVNGVYEREFSITMNFVTHEDTLIFNAATGGVNGNDPFASMDNDANGCLQTNQTVCNTRIGIPNYDVGHVFTTGAGGLSQIGVVCMPDQPSDPTLKAQSVTGQPQPWGDGFDIDYVAHEMGHEFGADHPFNDGHNGSCGGDNINPPTAYEPGSGSTIMAYAGICSPDDLQPHSDPYFHAISLIQIQNYSIAGRGDGCAVHTPTNNKLVSLPGFSAAYTIPYLTPFELTAPTAVDSVADTSVTYCWEQWNLGDVGQTLVNTHQFGPIFRSFDPVKSATRVFPRVAMVLADSLSDAGIENAQGEKAPDVARDLIFKLTVRDIFQGNGCFLIPDDSVLLHVINTGGAGFAVTSQNSDGGKYVGNTPTTITWDIAGTNVSPISAGNVDIFMSADGGYTWPYQIGTFVNNGSASIIMPNPDTTITAARFKVKGTGNVFFNVNKSDFAVYNNPSPNTAIQVYPSPVHDVLHIYSGDKGILQCEICYISGKQVMHGEVTGELDIPVNYWPRGVYMVKLIDTKNERTIKKIVVE